MKQPHILLKTTVVASSLLLGGGFVAYHAGAFHRLAKPAAQPADSQSSPTPEDKPSDGAPQPAPTIMVGTKSFAPMQPLNGLTPADTDTPNIAKPPDPSAPDTASQPPPVTANEPPPTPKLPKSSLR